ncbi:MAG TPA: hypothetical protein VGK27_12580 [Candidatus Deferrimicrobiaceae bacterium]|jgi:hypothetical protein
MTIPRTDMSRLGTYLLWFGVILVLYWPALDLLPMKDHPVFLLERELYRNDWRWFLGALSYNRTRVLFPGDFYLFRPLHMAIVAVEDILFRHDFAVQGVIGCAMFAATATILFTAARRLCGIYAATVGVLIWVSSAAGASIVLWQHIAPYSLAPGLLLGAVLLLHGERRRSPGAAAACVLAASLLNESAVVVALALSGYFLVAGPKATRKGNGAAFLFPALLSLALNAFDFYVLHPVPNILGAADRATCAGLFKGIRDYLGSVGVALLSPWSIRFQDFQTQNFLFYWPFWNLTLFQLSLCALPVSALVVLSSWKFVRRIRSGDGGFEATAGAFFLMLFFTVSAVCAFRMSTRGEEYLGGATYYYAIAHFAVMGMIFVLLSGRRERLTARFTAPFLLLIATHVFVLHRDLARNSEIIRPVISLVRETSSWFRENPGYCYSGGDVLPSNWSVLLLDYSCSRRPKADPLYLMETGESTAALCRVRIPDPPSAGETIPLAEIQDEDPLINLCLEQTALERNPRKCILGAKVPFGYEIRFGLDRVGAFDLLLRDNDGEFYVFRIDRNLVGGNSPGVNWWDVTDTDPAAIRADYRVCYSGDSLALVRNGVILMRLPLSRGGTNLLELRIVSTDDALRGLHEVRLSDAPVVSAARIKRVKEFRIPSSR